ncbi:MAG: type VI secretion protein IcmF/TssM N-terminal domain-containing protein [Alphaproteobacteria bacterium]
MTSLSSFELVLVVLGFGSLIFMLTTYLSGIGLKEQFDRVGLRSLSIVESLKQIIMGKRKISSLSFQSLIHDLFYGVLNLFNIYPAGPFHDSLRDVIHALEEKTGSSKILYKLPWFIMVGSEGSGKSSVLGNLTLSTPIPSPSFGKPDGHPLIQWWFYEKGIVIDIRGDVLSPNVATSSSWSSLLRALKRYRPHRPLDGLILAAPATYFTGPNKLDTPQLITDASNLSDQLIKIERILGLKVPLYFLLTKCDEVAGFQGFVKSLPLTTLEEPFGWSNPYATHLSFNPNWIKEAFQHTYLALFQGMLRIFGTETNDNPEPDDITIFPESFLQLEDSVQTYLNFIFKVGDYDDHFIFRGLFVTGTSEPNSSLKIMSQPFVNELFNTKIFGELGLATPIKKFFLVMNKKISFIRLSISGAFLMALYGLYWTNDYLSNTIQRLRPLIEQVQQDMETSSMLPSANGDSRPITPTKGKNILRLLDHVYHYPLRHILIPFSWISPTTYKLNKVSTNLYHSLIARNLDKAFREKAEFLTLSPMAILPSTKNYASPLETPEFLLLEGYVKSLADLERATLFYTALPETQDPFQIAEILNYLYGYPLSPDFLKEKQARTILIKEAPYDTFKLEGYRLHAEKRLYLLYDLFLKKVLDPDYIYSLAGKLQGSLHNMGGREPIDLETLKKSISDIKELMEFLTQAGGSWLLNPDFNPGSRYQKMVDQINHITLLGPAIPKTLFETSNKMYAKAVQYLRSYGSPVTGYFFVVSPDTQKLEPSAGLMNIEKQLDAFLQQSFMQKSSGASFAGKIPLGQFLHWDPQGVRNVLALIESYKTFLNTDLFKYPANLQDTLRQAGLLQTQRNIDSILEGAQSFYEEPLREGSDQADNARRAQALNMNDVGPLFIKILKNLNSLGGGPVYNKLKNLLFEQVLKTLKKLNTALDEGSYFQPSDSQFSAWNGEAGALFKGFNITDVSEMKDYFSNQSAQLLTMVINNAESLIDFLKADLFDTDIEQVKLISKWHTLIEQAIAYRKSKTSGSMKTLQKFMEEEGNKITYESCFTDLDPKDFNQPSSDYFTQKQNDLKRGIYKRCRALAAEKAAQQYNKIENTFNGSLANTFPFTRQVPSTPQLESEVSWTLLQDFFKELEELNPNLRQSLKESPKYGSGWKKIETFISQMDEVKNFFMTYFAPLKKDDEPGMSFEIKFRDNRVKESLGNQVSDWAFIFGDKSISLRQNGPGVGMGRWTVNNPVSFGFQWDVSAALWPLETSNTPALVKVDDRSLFVYEGSWSLLRALMIHAASPNDGASPSNNVLFKFEIPLGPNPNAPATTQAKLFIKLVPQSIKGQRATSFKIPPFPVEAPKLRGGS